MQRKQHHIEFVAQYILNDKTIVEVTDEQVEVIHKTQTQSPNHGGRPGIHTVSHWKRYGEDTLTSEEYDVYRFLLDEECENSIPTKEYIHPVDDFKHILRQHENHWVYHAIIPSRGIERVVVAKDLETLKSNRYGIAIMLKAFGV